MKTPNVVPRVQPGTHHPIEAGPRNPASVLARSSWSNWSTLFIESVKVGLASSKTTPAKRIQHARANCKNFADRLDHQDRSHSSQCFASVSQSAGALT